MTISSNNWSCRMGCHAWGPWSNPTPTTARKVVRGEVVQMKLQVRYCKKCNEMQEAFR